MSLIYYIADPFQVEGYALKKALFHSERVVQDILKKIIMNCFFPTFMALTTASRLFLVLQA